MAEERSIQIVTSEDVQRMQSLQQDISKLKEEIEKAERAGIDMTEQRRRVEQLEQSVGRFLSVYAPSS